MCVFVIGTVYVTSWTMAGLACICGFALRVVYNHYYAVPICNRR